MYVYSLVVLDHSVLKMVADNDHPGNPKSEFGLLLARQGGATVLGKEHESPELNVGGLEITLKSSFASGR